MEILKRTISALLALVLAAGMLPVPAIATETDVPPETTQAETVPAETIPQTTAPPETAAETTVETTGETAPEDAGETEPEIFYLDPITIVHVNPLYQGIADDTPVEIPALMTLSSDYLTDVDEVAEALRSSLEAREEVVTIPYRFPVEEYSEESFSELVHTAMDMAMDHTGVPTQGDYLKWQYQTWQVSADVSGDGDYWYFNMKFYIVYSTSAAQEAEMDTAVTRLLNQLNPTGSDYDKLRTVYDYMTENITYDYENLNNDSYYLKHTAYAALINKTSVCQGYAVLLYRLALELGIDCRVVTGTGNGESHGWNIVKLDGRYYNADATWDASRAQAGIDYVYFLRSDANFGDHIRDAAYAASAFYSQYPMDAEDYVPGQTPEETQPVETEPQVTEPVPTKPEETGIPGFILTEGLSIRNQPSVEGSSVGRYSYGEMVSIYEISGEWGRTDRGWITMDSVDIDTPNMREPERALRRYLESGSKEITITEDIVLVKSLEIPKDVYVYIEEGGSLTVPSGLRLDVGGYLAVYDGALTVEAEGILTTNANSWAVIDIWGGSLDVTGADISGVPVNTIRVLLNSSTVKGIGKGMLYGEYLVGSTADVRTALAEASQYSYMQLDPAASFLLEESITIPSNALWSMYFSAYEVVVPQGVTVTNNGDIWVQNGNLLIFEEGSRLVNNGYIYVDGYSELLMFGSFTGNGATDGYITGSTMSQSELEGFLAANDGYGWIHSTETTLTRNMTVNVPFGLYRYGRLIVPSGVTLTFNSEVLLYEGGEILVEDGGKLIVNAAMENYGTVTIAEGGTLEYRGTWTGNAPNQESHIHSYTQTVTDPTCTTRGYTTYTCSCGDSYVGDYVDATGHSMTDWSVSIQPACEAIGEERRDCGICEHYETRQLPATGHSYGDWYETKAPTTEAEGEERRDCASCGQYEVRAVEKLPAPTTEPTVPEETLPEETEPTEPEETVPGEEITLPFSDYEWEVLKLTNQERLAAGLNPLTGLDVMQEAAGIRAEELKQSFSHTRPDGSRCFTVLAELGIGYSSAAENIAYGYGTPQRVVNGWMNSDGHRKNILNASLSHLGVGEADDKWVQLFIGRSTYSAIRVIVPKDLTIDPGMTIDEMDLVAVLTSRTYGDSYLPVTDAYCQGYDPDKVGDQTVTISVLGVSTTLTLHTHNWTVVDCTAGSVCTECGAQRGSGKGHQMGNWEETKAPTCEEPGEKRRQCENCDHSETLQISPTGHDYSKTVTKPTCEEQGYATYTCDCGHSYAGDYVDALGHTEVIDKAVEATCTEAGLTEGKHCSLCEAVLTEQTVIPALGHAYDQGTVTTQPGCETEGVRTYTCANDKTHTYTETIPPLGHTEVIDKAVAATCTATGLTEGKHCSVCGTVLTAQKEVPALGHKWNSGVVTKEPTEEAEGVRTYTCTACGETRTLTIPTLDHVHKYTAAVTAPTCTERGYTTYTCRCGDSYVDSYVNAKGHSYGTWTVTTAASCTAKGTERRDCVNCDHYETREIAAKGHTEVIDKAVAATCIATGLTEGKHCSVCGTVLTARKEVPALGHKWNSGVVTKEPTEETEGMRTYTCTACGETRTETIPTLDHVHKYTAAVTAPTCTEQGYTTYTCRCGDSYVDDYVEADGHEAGEWITDETSHWRSCANCGEIVESGIHDGANCGICGHIGQGHGFRLGDANHDGEINAKDATRILQYSVGALANSVTFCEICAEVRGDDDLNAKDSTLILQFSVGNRTHFPAEE